MNDEMVGGVTVHVLIMLAAYRAIRRAAYDKGHSEAASKIGWIGPASWIAGVIAAAALFAVLGVTFPWAVSVGGSSLLTIQFEHLGGGALGLTAALLWAQRGLSDKWAMTPPANAQPFGSPSRASR